MKLDDIYMLLDELDNVQAGRCATLFHQRYTLYNGYRRADLFVRHQESLFKKFKYAVFNLPQSIPSRNGRKTFITNLCQSLLNIHDKVRDTYQHRISKRYEFTYTGTEDIKEIFPVYSKDIYPDKENYENHKLHFMHGAQVKNIRKAIEVLIIFARYDGYDLIKLHERTFSKAVQELQPSGRLDDFVSLPAEVAAGETPVKWTGQNKTEFIQLIYGLHKAKLINNGEGEITRLVELIADGMGLTLNRQWQSVHSKSIHARNNDYQAEIFNKLATAYESFRTERLEKC